MKSDKRSWFALVVFCATTALVAALGMAILFASATVAFAVGQSVKASGHRETQAAEAENLPEAPPTREFSGVVTDSVCEARHRMNSGRSPAECAQACVRKGASYVLVDGDRTYVLAGDQSQLHKVAGQRVRVEGSLEGSTIQVHSIGAMPIPGP